MRNALSGWHSKPPATKTKADKQREGDNNLELALESLKQLLNDKRIPEGVRQTLANEYAQVEAMLEKLEHGHLHIAVFGRVSVGKSSLLNALLNQSHFSTSPLHGETKRPAMAAWDTDTYETDGLYLIDTPGINEIDGEEREKMAHDVAARSDLLLFVVDGDLTDTELQSLRTLASHRRPIILVLNKIDRYTQKDRDTLLASLRQRSENLIDSRYIVTAAAQPAAKTVIVINEDNEEIESTRQMPIDIAELKQLLWDVLESEGKTLAALNASLFADKLNSQVTEHVLVAKKTVAEKVIRTYCISKGIAVAFNPIPVADLFAAAIIDATMIIHLAKVYGVPITRHEAQSLVIAIAAQMAALIGTVWAVNLVSSALKAGSAGVSTLITASAQGAIAYYSTYVVGLVAQRYLSQGKAWGDGGARKVVKEILESVDRDSIVNQAREDILAHLKT